MVSGNSRCQGVLPPVPWMMAPWWPRPRPVRSASWRWEIHQLVMGKSWEPPLKMEVYSWKNQRKSSFGGCSATFEYRRVYGMGHIMAYHQPKKDIWVWDINNWGNWILRKQTDWNYPTEMEIEPPRLGERQRNSPKHGAWTPKMGTPKNQKMGGSTARGIGKKLGFSQGILRPGPGASGESLRGTSLELRGEALVGAAGGAGSGSWSCRGATSP